MVLDGTARGVNKWVLLPCVTETPGLLDGEAMFFVFGGGTLIEMKVDVRSALKELNCFLLIISLRCSSLMVRCICI